MPKPATCDVSAAKGSSALLVLEGLTKRFGGVTASDDLALMIEPGEVHAIIGPNGAGKTTLIGQIAGEIKPDAGCVIFGGQDITALPAAARVRLGLMRSYQIARVFPELTVLENVLLALVSQTGRAFRAWRPVAHLTPLRERASRSLDQVNLGERATSIAGTLSHGEKRALELAMILVTEPRLLLIDEPMAGLGPGETTALLDLFRRLKGRFSMLLIEHDIAAVFALADRISVVVSGRVIITGTPAQVRNDPEVQEAYLGERPVDKDRIAWAGEMA
jgi:branched-chain amino acid transport system ATP-binding protein